MPSNRQSKRGLSKSRNKSTSNKRSRPDVAGSLAQVRALLDVDQPPTIARACAVVAAEHGLSSAAVSRAFFRDQKALAEPRRHGALALSEQEEEAVLGMIMAFSIASVPLQNKQIRRAIQFTMQKKVSASWVSRFKHRHRAMISDRAVKGIESRRVKSCDPALIDDWLRRVGLFFERHHFPAHARINTDETRLIPPQTARRVVAKSLDKANNRKPRIQSLGTLVPFVSAAGDVVASFYIMKAAEDGTFKTVRPRASRRKSWPRFMAITTTGYANKKLFKQLIERFHAEWSNLYPALNCVVFLDNCSIHRDDTLSWKQNFVLKMARKGLFLLFLPPNTTSFLQPLDDITFGNLKSNLCRINDEKCFAAALHYDEDGKIDLNDAMDAEDSAFTKRVIQKSWINTGLGIISLDEKKIRQRAIIAFGIEKKNSKSSVDLALAVIRTTPKKKTNKQHRIKASFDRVYSTDELCQLVHEHELAAEQKQSEREQRAQKQLDGAREKEQQRASKRLEAESKRKEKDALKKARQAATSRVSAERDEQQLAERCRCCFKVWRHGNGWIECQSCHAFLLCHSCAAEAREVLDEHESCCK